MTMKKSKLLISILLSIMLIFTMTTCGSKTDAEPETESETEAQTETETTTEESAEYDIASNLRLAGGDEKLLDTDYFRITLPCGPSWDYTVDSKTSITIYNIASKEADCGGRLVSIIAYDADDKEYEVLPSYSVIGEKGGKVYIAEYPTDVQFNMDDEQATEDYKAVYDEVNKIRDGGTDSPIELK